MAATKTQATRRPTTGRFTRSAGTPAKRPLRVSRRKPQKTGMAKLLEGVTGGAAAKKGGSGGGKGRTAGLAMLAGAAGLALKNRGKLQGMLGKKGSGTGDRTAHADAPANPIVVTEGPAANTDAPPAPTA